MDDGLGLRVLLRRGSGVVGWSLACAVLDGVTAVISARALGVAGRGVYAVGLTIAALCAAVASFGVPTVGRVRLAGGELQLGAYFSVVPAHAIAGGVLAVAATQILVVHALSQGSWTLSASAGLTGMWTVYSAFMIDGLHAFGLHQRAVAANAAGSLAALIGAAALGVAHATPAAFLGALGASQVVQTWIPYIWLRREGPSRTRYAWHSHRALVRAGASAMPFQVSTFATFRFDRYIVAAVSGARGAGIYAVAATLSEATRVLPLSFGQVLLFGRSSGQVSALSERKVRRIVLATTWSVLAALGVAAPLILRLLFGSAYLPGVTPLRVLLIAEAMLAVWLLDTRLLVGSGRFSAASSATTVSAVAVVVADLILIPAYGLVGAAAASVIAYGAAAWLARRLLTRAAHPRPDAAAALREPRP